MSEKKESTIKVTDERATSGTTDEQVKISSMKASERTRAHLNSPAAKQRTFNSIEEMAASAAETFDKDFEKIVQQDKEKGFDITDAESIKKFEIDYTPLGYTIILKPIKESTTTPYGIIIPDASILGQKAIVIEVGLQVHGLEKGDVIALKPARDERNRIVMPNMIEHTFNGVRFNEISMEFVAGIFKSRKVMLERMKKVDE